MQSRSSPIASRIDSRAIWAIALPAMVTNVATALIGSDVKTAYNDADPADDAAGDFVPELTEQLTGLTNALADDLIDLGLTPCAMPES